MSQSIKMSGHRVFAVFALLLVAFSLFGGHLSAFPGGSGITPVAAYAAGGSTTNKGVNDLWDEVGVGTVGSGIQSNGTDMGVVVTKAQDIAKTITSILTIISFVSLLFWIAKLALSAGNPQTRRIAITGILVSGVALALFGGAWVVVSFFWNILSGVSVTGP